MKNVKADGKRSRHYSISSFSIRWGIQYLCLLASVVSWLAGFAANDCACFFYFPKAIDFCSIAIRKQEAYKMMLFLYFKMELRSPAVFLLVSPLPSPAECCLSQHVLIGLWRSRSCWYHFKPKELHCSSTIPELPM